MKKKLDDLAKPLSDDPKLIKKIKDRIRKNEEYRVKLKYVNLEGFVYVDEEEFYNFVKDNYKDKHPELIPRMPKEHQKIWKTEAFYFDFSYRRDVDGVNETTDVEELRRLYWKKAGECQKLIPICLL